MVFHLFKLSKVLFVSETELWKRRRETLSGANVGANNIEPSEAHTWDFALSLGLPSNKPVTLCTDL